MSDQKQFGWARNVFMAILVVGGMVLTHSTAFAAETATTTAFTQVTTFDTPSALTIQEQSLVAAFGQTLMAQLHVSGGMAPYRWSLLASGLPDGVWFDATTGQLGGSPNRTGRFTFTIQASDALATSVSKVLTLDVVMPGDARLNQTSGEPQTIIIDLDNLKEGQLQYLVDTFADDAPLIYVGPNAPTSILKVNIAQMRIQPDGLYRVEGGTPSMVNEAHKYSDVYYVDPTGRRHAFPTETVFKSWYKDEPKIDAVPDWKISNIPLRQNVTFRPGSIVRLENTREFYRVQPSRTLKKFQDEATYQRLAPSTELVSVLAVSQVGDYQMDVNTIKGASDFTLLGQLPTQPGQEMSQE